MNKQIMKAQHEEWEAWREMFKVMAEILGLTEEELNKMKYRIIFEKIERWSYYDRERRKAFLDYGDDKEKGYAISLGSFWQGDLE